MKQSALFLSMMAAFLTACGGGGGDNQTVPDQKVPPPSGVPTPPPANLTPVAGQLQSAQATLGDVRIAPNRAERPDAATWAQLNTAIATSNRLRAEVGQPSLALDENLAAYAAVRARESATLFEHTRPNGQDALDLDLFPGYGTIGENLAAGNASPEYTVATQWRNSPGHYQNIISPSFSRIGMGYYYGAGTRYKHHWTQTFAGEGNITSLFRFISPLNRQVALTAIQNAGKYDAEHKLHIQIPIRNPQDSIARIGRTGIYSTPHMIDINSDHHLLLRPHRAAGWSYQTFGEIVDTGGVPEAYINLGKPFVPDATSNLRASYQGYAIGDLGQHSRVIADVKANLNFSADSKTLALQLYNSQRTQRDLESGQSLAFSHDGRLDFQDTLRWNGNAGQFESTSGRARLYGPNAAELGGQFQRSIGPELYRSAYGANRTQ
ncbi:MAG: CAP domain-containing protein [Cardiobacteriaceae bacterium]|nr:CAP domain-containing protein [Cardiobacteriaceae bacterium]